ncbi:MAG: hypothetical protein H6736_24885 [Alphaproteobacteria bacterium]|nr:hypothetical protein [Alphaproteobacteria bacterium]MCB9695053.1 hypothetical protein [Alphaproteobacteria bacterium]
MSRAASIALLAAACAGEGPFVRAPDPYTYDALLTHDDEGVAGSARLLAYTAEAADTSCAPYTWLEVRGLCDLTLHDDQGFADIPDLALQEVTRRQVCRYADRGWQLLGGQAFVEVDGTSAVLQIAADEACTVIFPPGVPRDRVCETDVFVRLELDLVERSTSGVLEDPLRPGLPWDEDHCGPAFAGLF